ncbi:enoyl-CoA hydratase family protein [Streptomyces tsukubensis]|uniref:Enoyl-CoA hydratase n=1 Tax=Streptomyces tsukubensis TaxID=83656 RepID=A0A1V4A0J0_9ACTN|nr:enoyl-CoA hydratase family protein [Streptomyces tsukubensis]OON72251.1 enoyl-CoA hydratase [Streptomyces tsukubensis]QFR94149.1 enoyl-CoA hydratase family protein [Streptomyces tsukubensis]
MTTDVTRTHHRGIITLTLDAQARRNALSAGLVDALAEELQRCATDEEVRGVVVTHTGTTFCAGADLREPPRPAAFVGLLRQIVALPKPVVARVAGHARAGGLGLIGACDIAVAGPAATFAFTEVRLGLAPAVISLPLLPRMEPRAAARYCLTGERFGPEEAARAGLVTEWAADIDKALAPVLDGLRGSSPQGLAATKKLVTAKVLDAFDQQAEALAALSARLFATEEAQEGMASFLERRDPAWAL